MALQNPKSGLTPPSRLRLDKRQSAKVLVTVQPGDEIEAGGVVAEQLVAAGMTSAPKPKPVAKSTPTTTTKPTKKTAAKK